MRFRLDGEVSSANLSAIRPALAQVFDGQVTVTSDGLHLDGVMEGDDARDVNRRLLSALRRAERRTRLRAEWTADGVTYRFFDYALKSERPERDTRAGPLAADGRDAAEIDDTANQCRTRAPANDIIAAQPGMPLPVYPTKSGTGAIVPVAVGCS